MSSRLQNLKARVAKLCHTIIPRLQAKKFTESRPEGSHCVAPLSPVERLPFEILSYIFMFCMETEEPFAYWAWTASFPPAALVQVCSSWRYIALSSHRLWSSLSIHISPGRKWRNQVDLMLARSGNVPLSLELIWYPPKVYDIFHQGAHKFIFDELAPLCSRWERLHLFLPDNALIWILSRNLPLLEVLVLGRYHHLPSLDLHGHTPSLRSVSFPIYSLNPLLWHIPWNQLIEVNPKGTLSGSQILRLFAQCPRLERCRLRVGSNRFCLGDPEHVLVMRSLKSVIFDTEPGSEGSFGLFDRFILPSLISVEFCNVSTWPEGSFLAPLLALWGCSLQTLSFVNASIPQSELRDAVMRIPSLTGLECSCSHKDIVPVDLKEVLVKRRLEQAQGEPL